MINMPIDFSLRSESIDRHYMALIKKNLVIYDTMKLLNLILTKANRSKPN